VGTVGEADAGEQLVDAARPGRPVRHRQPGPTAAALHRQRDVVGHRERAEQAGLLERLPDAQPGPARLRCSGDV
jgi:hypothetical protein